MLGRALRHAAAPFKGVSIEIRDTTFQAEIDLADAISALPEKGLVAALEDDGGRRGLFGACTTLIDALIEAQTTGRIDQTSLPPRPVTRIDEALCRDFFDLVLASLAKEGADVPGRDWPLRMRYGSRFSDRSQINLLLPEASYRQFSATVAFTGTEREAQFVLTLPADPTLAQPDDAPSPKADAAWTEALTRLVGEAPLSLEAVLLRTTLTFGEVTKLGTGDVLPFDQIDLKSVHLEDGAGRPLISGRLGQLRGKRAVCVAGATAGETLAPKLPDPAAPPMAAGPAAPPLNTGPAAPTLDTGAASSLASPPGELAPLGAVSDPPVPPSLPPLPSLS